MLTLDSNQVLGRMHLQGIKTQAELAERLDVSRQYITYLLKGQQQPSTDFLLSLAKLLNCKIDEIVQYPTEMAQ